MKFVSSVNKWNVFALCENKAKLLADLADRKTEEVGLSADTFRGSEQAFKIITQITLDYLIYFFASCVCTFIFETIKEVLVSFSSHV